MGFESTLERFLIDFGWMLKSREAQIHFKNQWFLIIFVISTNLPKRRHMIAILVNMAPNMGAETLPKTTPEAKKIDEKLMSTSIKNLHAI